MLKIVKIGRKKYSIQTTKRGEIIVRTARGLVLFKNTPDQFVAGVLMGMFFHVQKGGAS